MLGLTSGNGVKVVSNTALTSGKLLHLKTTSSGATSPVHIEADNVNNGTIARIDGGGIRAGNGLLIEGGSGTTMTTGSLLKLETSTQTPSNGVMQIVANNVTSGTIIRASGTSVNDGNVGRIVTSGIRAGNGLLIEGGSGTTMTTGSFKC